MPVSRHVLHVAVSMVILTFAAPAKAVELTFQPTAVVASGLGRGAETYWFSVAREPQGDYTRVVRREKFLTAGSRETSVTFALTEAVPKMSIWVVVDVKTGEYAIANPSGRIAGTLSRTRNFLKKDSQLKVNIVNSDRMNLDLIVVRPRVAVWRCFAREGVGLDIDPLAGTLGVKSSSLRARRGTTASPTEILTTDLVILLDPSQLELLVAPAVAQ